ncbi:MAG: gliding motility-associated C-terminal domain-containing protein [Bacteroidales bacterium]|nr:gliding motility-associated C-terminal domain-containing protein [Bacteroidales bacterium]
MKTKLLLLIALFGFAFSYSQTYTLNASTDGNIYSTCNAILFDDGGEFSNYSDGQDYEITFSTTAGSCIRVVIEDYDIENNYDYLYFYDGTSSASTQIGARVTSYPMMPPTTIDERGNAYYAISGSVTIRFTSDGATVRGGFKLRIDCPENCVSPSCTGTALAGEYCNTSTPICDFNGYCGNTSTDYPTDHDEIDYYDMGIFCGGINNNSWLSFVAESSTAVLDVWVSNCQGSTSGPIYGIQLQVYESDCSYGNFTPKSNCWSPAKQVNGQIVAENLTVGNTYLLMIDGFASDNCEYTFAASSGVIVADAGSNQTICEGQSATLTASGGTNVVWSATPSDPSLIGQENNLTITVSPSQTTTYNASVSGSNPNCPGTADVVVFVDAASANFSGLASSYCETDGSVALTGNYGTGVFSGSGISGSNFNPSSLSPGTYNVTYSYNYSVVTAFFDDFDPWPDAGWVHGANSGTSSWQHGTPKAGNGDNTNTNSNSDPLMDHSSNTDNKVWGQGLSDSDGDGLGGHYDSSDEWLKSPAINCSGLSNTVLSFWRYANFEPNWDQSYVQISTNGSTFTDLGEPYYPLDDQWVQRIIDISAWADGQATVYIRWRSISDGSLTYSGWNIDDVSITGVQAGGSCVSSDIQAVTINALPDVEAGSNFSICAGQTISLSGSVSGNVSSGTWTSSGTGSFANSASLSTTYTPSASDITNGTVNLTLTSANPAGPCSTSSDFVTVTINPLDNAQFTYSSGTFCSTDASNPLPDYIATPGGSFSSTPAGLVINSSTGQINPGASTTDVTYTVTYQTTGTCPASSTFELTITSGFNAEFDYSGPFCQGSSNPLPTHISGTNGVYSSTTGIVFVNTGTGQIDLSASTPGTHSITNTIAGSGGCATATHTVSNIVIYEVPTANAGSDAVICEGEQYLLDGSFGGSATTATWTSSGTGSVSSGNYIPSAADIAAGNVILTYQTNDPTAFCGSASDEMIITINPAAQVNAGSDAEVCENQPYECTGTFGGSASSATWSSSGTGVFDGNIYTPSAADISTGFVTITYTTDNPEGVCEAVSDNFELTFNQAPQVSAGEDIIACQGDEVSVLATTGGTTMSVFWTTTGTGSFVNPNLTGTQYLPSEADLLAGNIYLLVSTNNPSGPCEAAVDSILLKINPLPELFVSVDSSTCAQSDGSIYVFADGGSEPYSFIWNTGATSDSLNNVPSGTYNVTVTDNMGCSVETIANIFDIGAGTLSFSGINNIKCFGENTGSAIAEITGGTPNFVYSWSNGATSEELSNVAAGWYNLTVVDANNCTIIDSIIISQPDQLIFSDTVYLENNLGNVILEVSGGTPGYTFLWSDLSTESNLTGVNGGTYNVTISDINNCEISGTFFIEIPLLEIPNVFTPNDDGKNDTWEILGISALEKVEIYIYNRWGVLLFEYTGPGTGYAEISNRWNGVWNGKDLPLGSYVYIVNDVNTEKSYNGTVTIKR